MSETERIRAVKNVMFDRKKIMEIQMQMIF